MAKESAKGIARKQLRRLLNSAGERLERVNPPKDGWISSMRKALNMSAPYLAKRAGITKSAIYQAERNEREGAVTLKHMEKMASALGGRFVYAIVPDGSIEDMLASQAHTKAKHLVKRTSAHMALEQQSLSTQQINDEVERLAKMLASDPPPNFWEDKMNFDEPEGATPLDPDEIVGLKFSHITSRGELDELEQANITDGLSWLERRRGGDILTDEFVRTLHKRLFGDVWDWAGTFRLREKNIGIDPRHIGVQLRQLLGDARYWADNDVYQPLEAAARFHHRMVQIHPFANGNGRHARIAADVFLNDYFDHPPIEWASGVDLQADSKRRTTYIAALRAADKHDYKSLLTFVNSR